MQLILYTYTLWLLLSLVSGQDVCSACSLVTQCISSQVQSSRFDTSVSLSRGIFWENILEDICSEVSRYGRVTGEDGDVKYVPAFDGSGHPIEHSNFEFNRDVSTLNEHHCVGLVDDNYDELLEALVASDGTDKESYIFDMFCKQITKSCV